MMKSWAFWMNGAAVTGVAAMVAVSYGVASPGIDTMTTASVDLRQADHFMVVDHGTNRTCILALHRAEGYDVHRVEPGNCETMPRIAAARVWQDTSRDTVRIADRTGKVLMRLSADDRFGWTVTQPLDADLTFEAF